MAAILVDIKSSLATEESIALDFIGHVCEMLEHLCNWITAKTRAIPDADRYVGAAQAEATIAQEISPRVRYIDLRSRASDVLKRALDLRSISEVTDVIKSAALIPVPPFLMATRDPYGIGKTFGPSTPKPSPKPPEEPIAVRVMLALDGRPWANPQVVRARTVYGIGLTLTIQSWPDGMDKLQLDFVTTLPPEAYRATLFTFERPSDLSIKEFQAKGHIEFQSSQSLLSEPALLQLRALFFSTSDAKKSKVATVIGYHKLKARVSDPNNTPLLSKYRALDDRIVPIVDEFRDLPGVTEAHLSDFVDALAAMTNYMGNCAQSAIYQAGDKIDEQRFQDDILKHLRSQLGEDVLEAPKQAGGITDIQYRSVTIELKVEDKVSDRKAMLAGYENQPTQYSSGVGSQLGILCVLDVTEKKKPPAPPQNNLVILKPELHGFPDGSAPAPSRIVAIVIDGNLRKPSSYSR